MKKIIHIDESPITSYPSIANMLSMAWGKKEELLPWLSDHFVQLVVRSHHDTRIDYYDHADLDNNYRKIYGMPGYSWMRNNTDTIKAERFTDYIEFAVDHEYCLEPCLDNFYFSFSNCYQKHHYIHSTFIYGYDNEEEIVYAADFWELGKYSTKMINYNEINQSFNNEGIVNLFRYYKAEYEFNKKLLISSCRDYLESTDSNHLYEYSANNENRDVIFGVSCYDYIKEYFHENNDYIDFIPFHIFYDHKIIMRYRLEYLKSVMQNNVNVIDELIVDNEEMVQKALELRNLVLKYSIARTEKTLSRIYEKIDMLKEHDIKFMNSLIESLEMFED